MEDSARVLLVTPDYPPPPGGIQTITRNLERGLTETNHEVTLLHLDPREYDAAASDFFPRPRWLYTPRATISGKFVYLNAVYRETIEAIETRDPDVVHAMHIRNWPALVAAHEHGIPTVLSTYALELEERVLAANAIAEADVVHAISEFTASLVRDAARSPPEIALVPPSIDVDAYREAVTDVDSEGPGPVVTLARFVDRKNVETVIEAWKRLSDRVTEGRELIVAGDGPNREALERRAAGHEDVRFVGWVQGREKRELLGRADAFALVPRRDEFDVEGFGIVYIEAQAAGTPVVGSKHGGAPEAIDEAGIVVDDEEDPSEVAEAILTVISDGATREELLTAANARIDGFGIPAVTESHLSVYETLLP